LDFIILFIKFFRVFGAAADFWTLCTSDYFDNDNWRIAAKLSLSLSFLRNYLTNLILAPPNSVFLLNFRVFEQALHVLIKWVQVKIYYRKLTTSTIS